MNINEIISSCRYITSYSRSTKTIPHVLWKWIESIFNDKFKKYNLRSDLAQSLINNNGNKKFVNSCKNHIDLTTPQDITMIHNILFYSPSDVTKSCDLVREIFKSLKDRKNKKVTLINYLNRIVMKLNNYSSFESKLCLLNEFRNNLCHDHYYTSYSSNTNEAIKGIGYMIENIIELFNIYSFNDSNGCKDILKYLKDLKEKIMVKINNNNNNNVEDDEDYSKTEETIEKESLLKSFKLNITRKKLLKKLNYTVEKIEKKKGDDKSKIDISYRRNRKIVKDEIKTRIISSELKPLPFGTEIKFFQHDGKEYELRKNGQRFKAFCDGVEVNTKEICCYVLYSRYLDQFDNEKQKQQIRNYVEVRRSTFPTTYEFAGWLWELL